MYVCVGTFNEHHGFLAVRSSECSTVDRVAAVLRQPESIKAADIELNVSVSGCGAVIENVVLVEITEGDDAGVARTGP